MDDRSSGVEVELEEGLALVQVSGEPEAVPLVQRDGGHRSDDVRGEQRAGVGSRPDVLDDEVEGRGSVSRALEPVVDQEPPE